jgi:hypothetical protein
MQLTYALGTRVYFRNVYELQEAEECYGIYYIYCGSISIYITEDQLGGSCKKVLQRVKKKRNILAYKQGRQLDWSHMA